jgi:replicative DNA helicase
MTNNFLKKVKLILANKKFTAEQKLAEINHIVENEPQKELPPTMSAENILEEMQKTEFETEIKAIKTDFYSIDVLFGGLMGGDIWVIGGRPSMGTTQLQISLCQNILNNNNAVLFISSEKSSQYIIQRFLSTLSGIKPDNLFKNQIDNRQKLLLNRAVDNLRTKKLYITDALEAQNLPTYCIEQIEKNNIKVVVIDSIQELYKGLTRKEMELISNEIIAISKKYKVAFLIGSQISRNVEMRGGEMIPRFSDFRLDYYLERQAAKIIAVYRPEYYGITASEHGEDLSNVMELHLLKNNHGSSELAQLKVYFSKSKIEEIEGSLTKRDTIIKENIFSKFSNTYLKHQIEQLRKNGLNDNNFTIKTGLVPSITLQNNDSITTAVKYYLQTMDIEMLECVLDMPEYQDTPKNIFLNKLEVLFDKFKNDSDTFFYTIKSKCGSCRKGQEGFSFVGNNTGNYFNLLFYSNKEKLIDLHECSNMQMGKLGVSLNSFIPIDNSINLKNDSPF